jgi:Mg/Co/Ni transporter MgtE
MSMMKIAIWFAESIIQDYDRTDINELCDYAGCDDVIDLLQEMQSKYRPDLSNQIQYANEYKKEREQ